VLELRLSERDAMVVQDARLVMKGTMGKPTFWDWSVELDEQDVVDFVVLLSRPEVVRFLVDDPRRWQLLRTAARGAVLFAWHSARLALFGSRENKPAASSALEEKS
jgi:hypothetical protein